MRTTDQAGIKVAEASRCIAAKREALPASQATAFLLEPVVLEYKAHSGQEQSREAQQLSSGSQGMFVPGNVYANLRCVA